MKKTETFAQHLASLNLHSLTKSQARRVGTHEQAVECYYRDLIQEYQVKSRQKFIQASELQKLRILISEQIVHTEEH